ncbi:MAG TPA: acyltransferase [Pyrinomonadaceae bacterium]|nr:acyltransferase [Pyrinomonadaceae bacterium]
MSPKRKEKTKVYFPGLHGLRFCAAMMVVFSHVELMKDYHGHPNLYSSNLAIYESGRMGVTLFFVLSGFLISYLLLTETKVTGSISVKKFYGRRILRIWPLYYLLVFLTFIVLPRITFFAVPKYSALMPEHFWYTLLLYIFLLPQVALSVFEPVPFAEPLWSIGVEEQFYLIWPVLMKYVRNFLRLSIAIIIVALALKYTAFWVAEANRAEESLKYWNYLLNYLYFTRIECMAIGGLGAWLVFARRQRILDFIFHRAFQVALYAVTVYFLVSETFKPVYNYLGYAACFALIIVNVAANPRSLIRIENKLFVFLGNISFSIYMFHEIVIKLVLESMARTQGVVFNDAKSNLVLHSLSIVLTLAVSTLAYYGFEKRFLRLKSSIAVVESGQDLIERGAPLVPTKSTA